MTKLPPGSGSLAEFELLVMLAALRLGPDGAYTVSIAADIERRTGRLVRRANVYTTLERLETKRLISTRLGDPRVERGGRRPRLVTVTAAGLAAVRATTTVIRKMVGELEAATSPASHAARRRLASCAPELQPGSMRTAVTTATRCMGVVESLGFVSSMGPEDAGSGEAARAPAAPARWTGLR